MNVSAVISEASTSHQPLPFKGTPIVNFSRHFLIVIHHNIADWRFFMKTFQLSLISLLILCSLSMKVACQGTMKLEESCLDTICAALACLPSQDNNHLNAQHTGMHIHHTLIFTVHLDDQQSTDTLFKEPA